MTYIRQLFQTMIMDAFLKRKNHSPFAQIHLQRRQSITSPLHCRLVQRQVVTSCSRWWVGGGGQLGGFDALDYRKIRQENAGNLGMYEILSVLPDKVARFLFEFHAHRFESLDLPFLPADRSDFDVHGALLDDKVREYVILCSVCTLYIYYIN